MKKNENASSIRALEMRVLRTGKGCPDVDKIESEYIWKYLLKCMFSNNKIFHCRGKLLNHLDGMGSDWFLKLNGDRYIDNLKGDYEVGTGMILNREGH